MRLLDLEPEWVANYNAETGGHHSVIGKDGQPLTMATAQGILFLCPKCFAKNNGPIGTHSILVWFKDRGVPEAAEPKPARWAVNGTGFHNLSLHPSIDLTQAMPDEWHGFVTNGKVT